MGKPPYNWNDFKERWKDEAVNRIAFGGDEYTTCYWGLAPPQDSYPNWIAQWFLYHKFRYTDGRGQLHRNLHCQHSSQTTQRSRGQKELARYGDDSRGSANRGENRDSRMATETSLGTAY